jgi:phosphate transport system protein
MNTNSDPPRMRRHFEEDLLEVKRQILVMGGHVESMIAEATRNLVERDAESAVKVLTLEREVNRLQNSVDEACLRLLALHQPLATDLRFLAAVMKMTADLERMGDLAVNIVQSARKLESQPPVQPYIDLPRMAHLASVMVRNALNALIERRDDLAREVLQSDSEVDALKHRIIRDLLEIMKSDASKIDSSLQLVLISRHFERIADHATNIAEEVIYIVTGKDVRHHQDEMSSIAPATGPLPNGGSHPPPAIDP